MEELYSALSAKLSEAGTGVNAVFYEDELLDVLPENMRNRETLEAVMKKLNDEKYIDVRYARGSAFCLSFIRPYVAKVPEEEVSIQPPAQPEKSVASMPKRAYAMLALCSFLGGLIGGLCVLIGAVI